MKNIYRQNEINQLAKYLDDNVYDKVVVCSGHFSPTVHRGHLALFREAAALGHLVVCVNGRESTIRKYGVQMVSIDNRMELISELRSVSQVLEWDQDNMSEVIRLLKPNYFCNGGDRSGENQNPEELLAAQEVECIIKTGVGDYNKLESNSAIIKEIQLAAKAQFGWDNII
jgi:glycerol-3-phosphate cytidylyltransferase-like family protein